jgi:glycosyltransferase involved in cell wall biosynthesis
MYEHSSVSLAISAEEISFLRSYISKPVLYIPPYFFEVPKEVTPFDNRTGIFFIGGFNHPPNQDAMRWFLEEVYPMLEQQNITLTIAGSKMPEFIFNYKKRFKSLVVLSDVSIEELNDIYTQTRIAIVPLRSGAGVKGKVIEAMAKGVPVVGTDIAFEGMPKDHTYLYSGVNTPEEFAAEIVRIYNDKVSWEELSDFGKHYVTNNFNKDSMKKVFADLLK